MSERSKKQPHEARVSGISLNFGILLLLLMIAIIVWAARYLPRDLSPAIRYEITDPRDGERILPQSNR